MKPLVKRISLAVLAAALALLWPALRLKAFNPQPDPPAFGMIGIDPFSTARVGAICSAGPLPGGVPPGPCDVTMDFRDLNGVVVTQKTVSLMPGQGAFLDLMGSQQRISGRRAEYQPGIRPVGRGFVLGSVEVFDDFTGRSLATLSPTDPKSLSPVLPGQ
jgi:hypothetical protein